MGPGKRVAVKHIKGIQRPYVAGLVRREVDALQQLAGRDYMVNFAGVYGLDGDLLTEDGHSCAYVLMV